MRRYIFIILPFLIGCIESSKEDRYVSNTDPLLIVNGFYYINLDLSKSDCDNSTVKIAGKAEVYFGPRYDIGFLSLDFLNGECYGGYWDNHLFAPCYLEKPKQYRSVLFRLDFHPGYFTGNAIFDPGNCYITYNVSGLK